MIDDNFCYKKLVRNLRKGTDERNVFHSTDNNKQDSKESSSVRLLKELQLNTIKRKK